MTDIRIYNCIDVYLTTVMSLIIRTKLNNFISGVIKCVTNFRGKWGGGGGGGGVRTIRGIVQKLDL